MISILPYDILINHKESGKYDLEHAYYLKPLLQPDTVKIGFQKGGEYAKIIKLLGDNYREYFHDLTFLENAENKYDVIITCFSDMIKLILARKRNETGWDISKIKRVLILINNKEEFYCTFNGLPLNETELDNHFNKTDCLREYLSDPSFAEIFFDLPMEGGEQEREVRKKYFKEVDKAYKVEPFYERYYNFERMLYDIMGNKSRYFLILYYDNYGNIEEVSYSNSHNLTDNIALNNHTEIIRVDNKLRGVPSSLGYNIVPQLTTPLLDEKHARYKVKYDFYHKILELYLSLSRSKERLKEGSNKYNEIIKKQEYYENLIRKIDNELELKDYYMYDYLPTEEKKLPTIPLMKLEDMLSHMKDMVEGSIKAEIDNRTIKSVEIFRKEFGKTQKQLREEFPFAEVGGQQYDGKHKFSTLRYKKDID